MQTFKQFINEKFYTGAHVTNLYQRDKGSYVEIYLNPTIDELKKYFKEGARGILTSNGDLLVWELQILHHYILKTLEEDLFKHYPDYIYINIAIDPDFSIHTVGTGGCDRKCLTKALSQSKIKNPALNFKRFQRRSLVT
jgi:hypothetical protein